MIQIGRCNYIFWPHEQQVHAVVNRHGTIKHSGFTDVNCAVYVAEENIPLLQTIPLLVAFSQFSIADFSQIKTCVRNTFNTGNLIALAALILFTVDAIPKDVQHITQCTDLPSCFHSNSLILTSTSALSASSKAISSIISSGLRWHISSPTFGFLLDSSNVALLIPVTSTDHDLGESAKVFCNFTNSVRSSSLSELVLPMLRPGSS